MGKKECCCKAHDITHCDEMGDVDENAVPEYHGTMFVGEDEDMKDAKYKIWWRKRVCPSCPIHGIGGTKKCRKG